MALSCASGQRAQQVQDDYSSYFSSVHSRFTTESRSPRRHSC